MKALSGQEWKKTQTERVAVSARVERIAPEWSTSTEITRSGDPDSRSAQLGRARAALVAVDARLKGDKKLLHASRDVSVELSRAACKCRNRTCSACPCVTRWKSCGVECECHGFCCNSVFHTPRLCIRSGALGEELYTKTDLPRGKLAFILCGRVMTVPDYWRHHERNSRNAAMRHYGFFVSWLGLPPVKYVVDPFEDMTGAVNHSCEPSVVVEACWANGKIYAVGRTRRNVMAKEALTVDYKWKGSANPKEFAELCRCREAVCRGLIAEEGSKLIEVSTLHYEGKVARLQVELAEAETALQARYEALEMRADSEGVTELEMELIRKENEYAKRKAHVEVMVAAVTRSRASLSQGSMVTTYVVEIPTRVVSQVVVSPLRKLMRRIRSLFSHINNKKGTSPEDQEEELQAEFTISSETNPCFTTTDSMSLQRVVAEKLRSCPSSARRGPAAPPPSKRFGLQPRPRQLTAP